MQRRDFLRYAAATTAGMNVMQLTACNSNNSAGMGRAVDGRSFEHGVASGDPLADRVILWTRVSDENAVDSAQVTCEVASDPAFNTLVLSDTFETGPERDYTVKVDAIGLQPGKTYWYRFSSAGAVSPIGRTRTLPAAADHVERLRFAITSCSNYPQGFFGVYQKIAENTDLDFVLHLGDYIYEYEEGGYGTGADIGRVPDPMHETLVLDDYRRRYALYRGDVHLQSLHRTHPLIAVWDDHETANDSYKDGAENHSEGAEGDWTTRKAMAIQAYFEWMPIRPFANDAQRIYRDFQYGDLADFFMLDTRIEGRDEPVAAPIDLARNDPSRTLLGAEQKQWLKTGMQASSARWKFLGQQVMFGQLNLVELLEVNVLDQALLGNVAALNMDQWDGYNAERDELIDFIADENISDVVVLTGDIHTSWAMEIYKNPAILTGDIQEPSRAVEFVCPSVTSDGFPEGSSAILSPLIPLANPHIKYSELETHGFVLFDVTHERTQAEYFYVQGVKSEADSLTALPAKTRAFSVASGTNLVQSDQPLSLARTLRTALYSPVV